MLTLSGAGFSSSGTSLYCLPGSGGAEKLDYKYAGGRLTFTAPYPAAFALKTGKTNMWCDQFTDVSREHLFYDAVRYNVESGLFIGTAETVFEPQKTMNMAELV